MLKLTGATKDYIWGGTKLKDMFGVKADGRVAEVWAVSVHPDGVCKAGKTTLAEYIKAHPQAVDMRGSDLPVLIKYIDAGGDLSVQVHPDDRYAREHEGDNGKTEMWYIISADDGAGIYCGFKRDTTKAEFSARVKDGTVGELLHFIPVKAGDCYLIKAGTVHAICKGCVICEVQQSSNVTYRVYDYNRVGADGKPRALHIDKALDVINFNKFSDETHSGEYKNIVGGKMRTLTRCDYFECRELVLDGEYSESTAHSFVAVNILSGSGHIGGKPFGAGDAFFVDRGEKLDIVGKALILLTTAQKSCYAGIDLGGTFIKCGIVDGSGNIIASKKFPTPETDLEKISSAMLDGIRSLELEAGVAVRAIGIGAPGTIDSKNGVIVYSNNISWSDVPLCAALRQKSGLPVYMTNDANAAAFGEYALLGGDNKNIIFVTLGTGVGGGIVIDGKLYEGKGSAGAEIGHQTICYNGEQCNCGRRGCLEAYASATALIKQTQKGMEERRDSALWKVCGDIKKVNGKTVFDGVALNDETAKKVLNNYISYLSEGLANLANIFRPDAILIGGGVSAAGDVLIKALDKKINGMLFGGSDYAPVSVQKAKLGNDAGLIGAALLARDVTEK